MKRVVLGVVLVLVAGGVVAQDQPGGRPADSSVADYWRAVRQGEFGSVQTPDAAGGQLIRSLVPGCTEKAVGFNAPVHALMPPVKAAQAQGLGADRDALLLLAGVFGFALGAGAMLARNLGRAAR